MNPPITYDEFFMLNYDFIVSRATSNVNYTARIYYDKYLSSLVESENA